MTLSITDPSASWDRTLPKPAALLQNLPDGTFTRRASSLVHHHLAPRNLPLGRFERGPGRRSTVPCISYHLQTQSTNADCEVHSVDSSDHSSSNLSDLSLGLLMRKRDASHMAEESHSTPESPPSPNAPKSAKEFCICQAEPKIPRPRNAFILYRQHHQAQVVAQNPGLPNPEISKIIGEQWRSLAEESKDEWKATAETEKAHHQQKYPNYQYKPRRNGRYSTSSSVSGPSSATSATVSENGTCLKCFGKVMNAPNAPYIPYPTISQGISPSNMMLIQAPCSTYSINGGPHAGRSKMPMTTTSPQSARVRTYGEVFGRQPQQDPRMRYGVAQPSPPNSMSPDSNKRRRYNGHGVLIPGHGETYPQSHQPYSAMERQTGRPDMPQQPRSAMLPPQCSAYPPRSAPPQMQKVHPQYPLPQSNPSLVLPPLKTATAQTKQPMNQKSGLEAMIRSIPALNKLKFLTQISPPLGQPSLASPPHEIRGVILAVEGLDRASVLNMTFSLVEQLEKDDKFAVKVFRGPDPYEGVRTAHGAAEKASDNMMSMESFLAMIGQWHLTSKKLIEWITTKPNSKLRAVDPEPNDPQDQDRDTHMSEVNGEILLATTIDRDTSTSALSSGTLDKAAGLSLASPMTQFPDGPDSKTTPPRRTPQTPPPQVSSPQRPHLPSLQAHVSVHVHTETSTPTSSLIPIALVPHYQLTTVDSSAIALPITDSYSPLSHWQWLATLWRGCVGPDVCVVVEDVNAAEHRNSSRASISAGSGEGIASAENREGVEVRLLDARAIVVRLGLGEGKLEGDGWEKAKRRVGFEVEEFLRR